MGQFIVTVKKLHKRSRIPEKLPNALFISGIVGQGFIFEADLAGLEDTPAKAQDTWYKDKAGNFYWGGGVSPASVNSKLLTIEQVAASTGARLASVEKFFPYLNDVFAEFSINTPIRQLCFLAQTGHESGGLYYTEELDSGSAYEGRHDLGNTHPNDGVKFKGRGLIQITGRNNYQWLSNSFKVDFVNSPEKLGGKNVKGCSPEQLNNAARSAGWFWHNNQLNAIADQINLYSEIDGAPNLELFKKLTRKINGGYNGLNDRINKYHAGLAHFR